MISIRYTALKLIISISILIGILSLLFYFNTAGSQQFTVQISASKTPLDIPFLAQKHHLTDSIIELKSEDWYRYVVGNFESRSEASKYASTIARQNGISGAFPREVTSEKPVQEQKKDSALQTEIAAITNDSSSLTNKNTENSAIPDSNKNQENKKLKKKSNSIFLWIFGDKNVLELKKDLIRYGNEHVPLFFRKFYIRVIEKAYHYPIILLFIFLISIFILNIVLALLVLYYSNQQKNKKERYIRIYNNLYEKVLQSYLFGDIDWDKALIKLKRIKKPLNRNILTSVLFNFQENLRGGMDTQIPEIFVKIGLQHDAIKSTKSSSYFNKVRGIRELTNLYPEGAVEIIKDYLNDPNDLVRAEAQTSYIILHPDKPFEFFRTLTRPFTRWTQLSAFYLFRLHQLPVPSFVDYLNSEHPNVRNFCLRMIIYFQQLENATEIIKMLESKPERTRFFSIRAINDLRLEEGKELIKKKYSEETKNNKLEIIKALKNIGQTNDFDFLESIIQSGSVSEKTEACRSLYFMNKEGMERINFMKQYSKLEIEKYVAHVTDPRN